MITLKSIAAVSYTHLDVYKRQHIDKQINGPTDKKPGRKKLINKKKHRV